MVSVGLLADGMMSINLSVLFSLRTAPGSGGEGGGFEEKDAVNGKRISVLLMSENRWQWWLGRALYVSLRDVEALSQYHSFTSGKQVTEH